MSSDGASMEQSINSTLYTKEELIAKFEWQEYFIFGLLLSLSAAIGAYFAWKGQKDNAEFILGGKSMSTFPMTMSLVASFMSAITLLGTPAEIYRYGTQYVLLILCYPLVMASAAYMYLPVFWKLNCSTSYEYLEWRFHKSVRVLASSCFTLQMVLYMSIVVYTPALAMSQITGFDVDLACVIIFIVCIFYTSIGGIKAVMWTDTVQSIVMFGSFIAVIIKGNYDAGGASAVFDRNYQANRIELFNFNTALNQRHSVWTMIVGGYFTWISIYGINQTQVQRYLTVKKESQAVKALWWNMLGIGGLLLMCAYAGLVLFSYYDGHGCDPIKTKLVDKPDQLFPLFVMQVMGDIPCVAGLFVAGVFSGALSTVSSGLNSLAAVTLQDFIQSACGKNDLSETTKTYLSKGLAVTYGVISYAVIFLVKYLPGVLEAALGIFGIVGGPVLGAFVMGMFIPWVNSIGAFVGSFSSLIFTMWFGFGQTVARKAGTYHVPTLETRVDGCQSNIWNQSAALEQPSMPVRDESFVHFYIYETSYMWFSAIPCLMSIAIGILISFLSVPQDPKKLNPVLISPAFYKLFAFWPKVVRNYINERLAIGSEFVPGEKERMLKKQQILQPEHHLHPDEEVTYPSRDASAINFVAVKAGKDNPAFNLTHISKTEKP